MALHRDIHWIGRQWAVTGYGMQAIDRRVAGQFDVEINRLWDDGLLESLREQKWFNAEDFSKGLAIARARFPAPPQQVSPPQEAAPLAEEIILPAPDGIAVEPSQESVDLAEPVTFPAEPETLKADVIEPVIESVVEPPQPAPQEDPLEKWFNKFPVKVRDRGPPPREVPSPLREAPVPPVTAGIPREPPQKPAESEKYEVPKTDPIKADVIAVDAVPPPRPAQKFQLRIIGCRAKFVRPWHVRIRR